MSVTEMNAVLRSDRVHNTIITFPAIDIAASWNGGVKLRVLNVFRENRHEAARRSKLEKVYITWLG
jgi:hypothetical protein